MARGGRTAAQNIRRRSGPEIGQGERVAGERCRRLLVVGVGGGKTIELNVALTLCQVNKTPHRGLGRLLGDKLLTPFAAKPSCYRSHFGNDYSSF